MSRLAVTGKIIATKVVRGLKWADVAERVGQRKEWVTAACLGQMTLNAEQADVLAEIFGLSSEEKRWLMRGWANRASSAPRVLRRRPGASASAHSPAPSARA